MFAMRNVLSRLFPSSFVSQLEASRSLLGDREKELGCHSREATRCRTLYVN